MCAPGLCATEAVVKEREIKNLPKDIKIYANVWKFVFIVEIVYIFYLRVSYSSFSGWDGCCYCFLKGTGDSQQDSQGPGLKLPDLYVW